MKKEKRIKRIRCEAKPFFSAADVMPSVMAYVEENVRRNHISQKGKKAIDRTEN